MFLVLPKMDTGHVCDKDAPREVSSLQVRSEKAAVSELVKNMPGSEQEQKQVEDEAESILTCRENDSQKQQKVSGAITVHSSLDAISAVCDEVKAMDLQT